MKEIWKDIEGFEGLYMVSNYGNVKSLLKKVRMHHGGIREYKEQLLAPTLHNGYPFVVLCHNSQKTRISVHRLVAIAFIPNPENKPQVNHIDGIKTNSRVDNLEWCTVSENAQHAFDSGLRMSPSRKGLLIGERNPFAKLTENLVRKARLDRKSGLTYAQLSSKYKVASATIREACTGKTWGHI